MVHQYATGDDLFRGCTVPEKILIEEIDNDMFLLVVRVKHYMYLKRVNRKKNIYKRIMRMCKKNTST